MRFLSRAPYLQSGGWEPLHDAALGGDLDKIRAHLGAGADKDAKTKVRTGKPKRGGG